MLGRFLQRALARIVRRGTLEVVTADGCHHRHGDGTEPIVTIRFADRAAQDALLLDPDLKLGELYTDGRLLLERGSIYDLLQLLLQDSRGDLPVPRPLERLRGSRLARAARRNQPARSRRNVAHHYDLDERFYSLFLDPDWQYSCAYFEHPGQSLDEAQRAKKRHVAAKLVIDPGMSVLDIGSGWGGLGLYLAEVAGAGHIEGITLSERQLAVARQRAGERGLDDTLTFRLADYRQIEARFDRVVSVGMFEHVGAPDYDTYFQAVRDRLNETGVALLHTIGHSAPPRATNPWITRNIFPGGYLPALSEITQSVERAGLVITDVETLRVHYAETLRAWRERFAARREEAKRLYDERFCRMWEFYLAGSESAFRFEDLVVFQIQLARRADAVPLTRDYIAQREAALRRAESATRQPLADAGRARPAAASPSGSHD